MSSSSWELLKLGMASGRDFSLFGVFLKGGAPSRARVNRWGSHKWLNSMVYGRYNELVTWGFVMVYKPTYNWGAPSCKGGDLWTVPKGDRGGVCWLSWFSVGFLGVSGER
jgi:hypothetical protein